MCRRRMLLTTAILTRGRLVRTENDIREVGVELELEWEWE
jgi:hypothetical protein